MSSGVRRGLRLSPLLEGSSAHFPSGSDALSRSNPAKIAPGECGSVGQATSLMPLVILREVQHKHSVHFMFGKQWSVGCSKRRNQSWRGTHEWERGVIFPAGSMACEKVEITSGIRLPACPTTALATGGSMATDS